MTTGSRSWLREPPRQVFGEHALETYLSTPDGQAPDRGWPALIFLHGNGECAGKRPMPEAFLDADSAHGPLRRVTPDLEQRIRGSFVVAAPQLPGMGGDVWQDYDVDVREIVARVIDHEAVNPDRISLCGFSYGANGAVRLSGIHNWHGLWLVDPPMTPPDSLPDVRRYRLAFGQFTVGHEAGWLDLMAADRRTTADYGPEHVRASWLDFGGPSHYDAFD